MTTQNHTLEKLKMKQQQLSARIQQLEAQAKEKHRKKEVRRKLIVGDFILTKARRDKTLDQLIAQLEPTLRRKGDRALFGLEDTPNHNTELSNDT